jgi:hypothetical protein
VDLGFDAELDYAFTDRWSISTSLPFIAVKYTDRNPPPSVLPFLANDSCRCWQSGFSDVGVTSRYNLVNRGQEFMVTPFVSVGVPSHDYDTAGEAVLGRRLKELRLAAAVGQRLDSIVYGLSAGATYQYTAVGRVLGVFPSTAATGQFKFVMHCDRALPHAACCRGSERMAGCVGRMSWIRSFQND